ncbi:unnamed protein product [Ascophyllum nodosum]
MHHTRVLHAFAKISLPLPTVTKRPWRVPCAVARFERVHTGAKYGYGGENALFYEKSRPGYLADALRAIEDEIRRIRKDTTDDSHLLVDLGCGTGKFTREILPFARSEELSVIGIEPVEAMRKQFEAALPGVQVKDGRGDNIPLLNCSARAMIAPQSFHWMSSPETLREVHRVLVPGGLFILVWNTRDGSKSWVRGLEGIIDPCYGTDVPRQHGGTWKRSFQDLEQQSGSGGESARERPRKFFGELVEQHFEHSVFLNKDELNRLVRSLSVVAIRPESEQADASRRIQELIESHPDTRDKLQNTGKVELFYDTEVYWCRRL